MRTAVVITGICLSLVGVSYANGAIAAAKRTKIEIPPEALGPALAKFAQTRDMQVLYLSKTVQGRRTAGANGELTADEALTRLLSGTGLTYRFLGQDAVTILPLRSASVGSAQTSRAAGETPAERTTKEGKSNSSRTFRVAQMAEGKDQGAAAVSEENGAAAATTLQEVVVTAEKRTELLENVPMSVSVISGAHLTEAQITSLQDIANTVPGMQVISDSPVDNEIVIRGIAIAAGINSSVATYVDEVPYTSEGPFADSANLAPNFDTYDLARVEVLRGPQGTLYGANALGGLIKYVTNEPDPSGYSATILVGGSSVAHGGNGYEAHGMVNLPLGATAALRLVAGDTYFPGFIDDPSRGKRDINGVRRTHVRTSLLWRPTEDFNVRLTAIYQRLTAADVNDEDLVAASLRPLYGDLVQERNFAQPQRIENQIYNATIHWNVGFGSLISSSSYTKADPLLQLDYSWIYGPILDGIFGGNYGALGGVHEPVHSWTQELRLASPTDRRLNWNLGAFYTNERADESEPLYPVDLNTGRVLYDFQPALGTYYITSTYREYAGFASADYHFTPAFEVGLGGRYSTNSQSYKQVNSGLFTGSDDFTTNSDQSVFTYSADAKYRFTPELMSYARVALGFVPGGPNDVIPGSSLPQTFGSSTTTNYELGMKGRADDGRVSYDLDAFDVEWKNIQLFAVFGSLVGITNGGTARSRGAEGEVAYRPVPGLTLGVNGAYTDARLTQDTPASFGGVSGDRLPLSPEVATTLSVEYRRALWSEATGFGGVDWRYSGDRLSEFESGAPRQTLPAYSMVNLHAGLTIKTYTVTAYAKNIGDVRAISFVSPETLGTAQALSAAVATPRTIGVTVAASF
jgi:iron complex outermembrane receptor protein